MLLLAGANVILARDDGCILLQQRKDGTWGLPGGLLEPGESLEETAVREVKEETNLDINTLNFIKVFSGAEYSFTLRLPVPMDEEYSTYIRYYLSHKNHRDEENR